MTDDIVTRLRNGEGFCINDYASCPFTNCDNCAVVLEAANEIERLRALNDEFARWVDHHMKFERDPYSKPSYAMFELTKVMLRYREISRVQQS